MKQDKPIAKANVLEWASDPKLPIGSNYCRCSGCGEYFTNIRPFEFHRKRGQCVDPATDKRLKLNDRGYWSEKGKFSK